MDEVDNRLQVRWNHCFSWFHGSTNHLKYRLDIISSWLLHFQKSRSDYTAQFALNLADGELRQLNSLNSYPEHGNVWEIKCPILERSSSILDFRWRKERERSILKKCTEIIGCCLPCKSTYIPLDKPIAFILGKNTSDWIMGDSKRCSGHLKSVFEIK